MIILHMSQSRALRRIKSIAFPAIMMFGTLDIMLLSPREAWKVEAAVVADPVVAGGLFVLPEGLVVSELSVTAIAIRHQVMMMVQCKEWDWDDWWELSLSPLPNLYCMTYHGVSVGLSKVSICKQGPTKLAQSC